MMTLRPAAERFPTRIGWLDSKHSFSFADHYDPSHMGFRALRVINEDRVAAGAGFPTHGHRDMEIISYVLEGALEHKDSIGTGSVIRPGDVQRMSAGKGILHSEYNHSKQQPVRFLQIWIVPEVTGLKPSYEQKAFPMEERRGGLRLVASGDGRDGSLTIHQDVDLYAGLLEAGDAVEHVLRPGRGVWVQVARGEAEVNGQALRQGDGLAVSDEPSLGVTTPSSAELLLFDLA